MLARVHSDISDRSGIERSSDTMKAVVALFEAQTIVEIREVISLSPSSGSEPARPSGCIGVSRSPCSQHSVSVGSESVKEMQGHARGVLFKFSQAGRGRR